MPVKLLRCVYCSREFSFTEDEQRYIQERGYEEPGRCPSCRNKAKRNTYSRPQNPHEGGGTTRNRYYKVSCFACGTQTTIYYRPSPDRPALCPGCNQGSYRKRGRRF